MEAAEYCAGSDTQDACFLLSPFGFGVGAKGPYGWYGCPQVGSTIKIELQGGDENKALMTSIMTTKSKHPWFSNPSRWGYVDPSGSMLQVDMSAGSWVWTHVSGDSISYDGSGNVVKVVKGNDTSNIQGSIQFNVSGNTTINTTNFNLNASGTAVYKASTHQFQGPVVTDSTIAAAGDITDETASGNTKTIGDFRRVYDSHIHHVPDNPDTSTPIPQI
jgi:hypothetical protein